MSFPAEHVGVPLMGSRQPDKSPGVPFSLPVDITGGNARAMVEQHHLNLYKMVHTVTSQIDNRTPESWLLRKKWKETSGALKKEVWNLDNAYLERLMSMEEAGAKYNTGSSADWNHAVLFELKNQIAEQGMDCGVALRSFQDADDSGLAKQELGAMLKKFNIKYSADQVSGLFKEISSGKDVATLADFETAFAKAEAYWPQLGFNLSDSGRLVKLLGSRLGKLKEVFSLFDPNGDGVISVEEFQDGLSGLHLQASKAEIQQLIEQFDGDANGMLDYKEFTAWLLGKRRDRKREQLAELEQRLTTFAQGGSGCQLRRTPRVWSELLTTEVEKRLIDNIDLIEQKLQETAKSRNPPVGNPPAYVTSTQLWRVLLEELQLKISTDHFTYFIQHLRRQVVDNVELVEFQPFVDYFRDLKIRRRRDRKAQSKQHDRSRRKTVRQVLTQPPPTRHDAVATAVVEAITGASWGGRLDSEIRQQRARAMSYYMEDPSIQVMNETTRPKFQEWLEQPCDHRDARRTNAKRAMQIVAQYESQAKESGTHAMMLAFKASDRDPDGNTGATGCISPEKFKAVIREICGTRMQGWNDFEGLYNVSPRQLDFCVEIAEKIPSRKPVWQYRDNNGDWRNYETVDCKIIEDAKRDSKSQVQLKIRGRLYQVNLDKMEQTLSSRRGEVPDLTNGRVRDVRCSGEPNVHAGMIRYGTFFARLAKASARATFEKFSRAGGAQRSTKLGALESETRKLLGGVTFELQQALAAKVQSMGGESAMRIAFERFDENRDGQISPDEFRKGLLDMDIRVNGKPIKVDQIDKIIEVLDQDGDGHLSYQEFMEHFGQTPKESAREVLGNMNTELQEIIRKNKTNLRKIFHAFDEDGDGSISAQELRLGLRALNIDLSANQVKEMIEVMDQNGDGSLDWNEFQSIFGDNSNVVAKGVSRSYRRVLENRQRIASLHPEIAGMRNKAVSETQSRALKSSAGEARLGLIRDKVAEKLQGHRLRLVDAFRVVDTNNSKRLAMKDFEKMLRFFDPLGRTMTSADVQKLFKKLDTKNEGWVTLKATRAFFAR